MPIEVNSQQNVPWICRLWTTRMEQSWQKKAFNELSFDCHPNWCHPVGTAGLPSCWWWHEVRCQAHQTHPWPISDDTVSFLSNGLISDQPHWMVGWWSKGTVMVPIVCTWLYQLSSWLWHQLYHLSTSFTVGNSVIFGAVTKIHY